MLDIKISVKDDNRAIEYNPYYFSGLSSNIELEEIQLNNQSLNIPVGSTLGEITFSLCFNKDKTFFHNIFLKNAGKSISDEDADFRLFDLVIKIGNLEYSLRKCHIKSYLLKSNILEIIEEVTIIPRDIELNKTNKITYTSESTLNQLKNLKTQLAYLLIKTLGQIKILENKS